MRRKKGRFKSRRVTLNGRYQHTTELRFRGRDEVARLRYVS